ncbi:MAG: sensor histidine kinase [Ilumatobacteraceae bacterium]
MSQIERGLTWLRRRDSMQVVDVLFAMFLTGFGIATVWQQDLIDGMREPNGFALVLILLTTMPIAFRSRAPLLAIAISSAAICWHVLIGFPDGSLPWASYLLVYSVAGSSQLRRAIAGLAIVWAVVAALRLADAPGFDGFVAGANLAFLSVAWGAGLAVRARRATVEATVREAEERANVERQRSARLIAEERLRIAQELHDVVAHSMSVIAVQAGVGAHVVDHRPDQAKAALEAISGTARSTLDEMRRLLGVLRDGDGNRSHAPAPALSDVARLVDDVRAAGVPVSLVVIGEADHLSAGVELSGYRIVQEALTNVIKHAGPLTAVTVRLTHTAGEVSVEVVDDGRGAAAREHHGHGADDLATAGGGHGLLGMRERVEMWGGTLATGPVDGGGYRVEATLPTAAAT